MKKLVVSLLIFLLLFSQLGNIVFASENFGTQSEINPVSDFASKAMTSDTATFSWTAASEAQEIIVEQSPSGENNWTKATTGAISIDSTSATVTSLTPATAYDFRLVVRGGESEGVSNIVSVTTDLDLITKLKNAGWFFDWEPGDGAIYKDLPYGAKERNKYDLYIPTNVSKTDEIGVILFIHGGSWISGDKGDVAAEAKRFAQAGYITASMNHSYANGKEVTINTILDEIQSTVSALKEELTERGYNVNKMAISGYSSGGHLASLYAYSRANVSVLQIKFLSNSVSTSDLHADTWTPLFDNESVAGILSLMVGQNITGEELVSGDPKIEKIINSVSPLHYVQSNSPPTILAYGARDQLIANGHHKKLAAKLEQVGVNHRYILYPNSDHALGNDPNKTQERIEATLAYLEKYLSPTPITPISDFKSAEITSDTATFSWTEASAAQEIIIEQSPTGKNNWTKATTGTISTDSTSATATGLSSATSFDFRLVVRNGENTGTSNMITITTRKKSDDGKSEDGDSSRTDIVDEVTDLVKNTRKKKYIYKDNSITLKKEMIDSLERDYFIELSNGKVKTNIPISLLPKGKDISFSFVNVSKAITNKNIEALSNLYDFKLSADGEEITNFDNQKVTLTFTINDTSKVRNWDDLRVVYIDKNGDQQELIIPVSYNKETSEVIAEVTHFSIYGVFENDQVSDEDSGDALPNVDKVLVQQSGEAP